MSDQILTTRFRIGAPDGLWLPIMVCWCGQGSTGGTLIARDQDAPTEMECCGRQLYWDTDGPQGAIRVIEADMAERR